MLAQLIEKRTGIQIRAHMHTVLDDIARQFDPETGDSARRAARLEDGLIRLPESSALWQQIINELTIGETYFLRDETLYAHLRREVFPALIAQKRPIRLLSIGCATGEEPYSLAITLEECGTNWDHTAVIGLDLNARALDSARKGVYRAWSFRHTPPRFRQDYFDVSADGWQIKPTWRACVRFQQANLMTDALPDACDLILCRNVLIYFARSHVLHAERRVAAALNAQGRLYLGPSEVLHGQVALTPMNAGGVTAYQRNGQADSPPKSPLETPPTGKIDVFAHLRVAMMLADQGDTVAAHNMLDVVLEADPMIADGHYLRAALFMESGDHDATEKSLRAALYCQRNHPLAGYLLGRVLSARGDVRGAVRVWKTAQAAIIRLQDESLVGAVGDMTAGQLRRLLQEGLARMDAP